MYNDTITDPIGSNLTSGSFSDLEDEYRCLAERKWWCFLLSSIVTFFGGLFVILLWRTFFCWCSKKDSELSINYLDQDEHSADCQEAQISSTIKAQDWADELMSGQSTAGRVLMVLVFLSCVASFTLYLIDTSSPNVELCISFSKNITQQIDVALNIFFLFHFFIRLIAAPDKLWFMLEMYSCIDYFTIPPSFVSIYLQRTWIGFRSLRALHLVMLIDASHHTKVLNTTFFSRFVKIISIFILVWLSSAGIVHLLENSGDLPDFANPQNLSYSECLYLLLSAVSTLGFGGMYCKTILGRVYLVYFLILNLFMLAIVLIGNSFKSFGEFWKERHSSGAQKVNYYLEPMENKSNISSNLDNYATEV